MTARLSLWEFDKLLKPKAWFMAFKKKISSLRGHVISSISTLYQVKFRVRKFVPSANPPYNQYHSLSGRFISGLYSTSVNENPLSTEHLMSISVFRRTVDDSVVLSEHFNIQYAMD